MSSFADLMKNKTSKNKKQVYNAVVLNEISYNGKNYILVDASLKVEGIILSSEFITSPAKGSTITAIQTADLGRYLVLSHVKAEQISKSKLLYKAYTDGNIVSGHLVSSEGSNHKIDLGFKIFGTLVSEEAPTATEFYIIKMQGNNNITLATEKIQRRAFTVGEQVTAKVISIFNSPYICEIDNCPAILDALDYSWEKKDKPYVNEIVTAQVIDIINGCPILNVKVLSRNYWQDMIGQEDKYINTTHKAIILSIKENGLLVKLNGIEGFVSKHEISWFYHDLDILKTFQVGQEINVKVTNISVENRKIYLSIRDLEPNPFDEFIKNHQVGDIITAKILYDSSKFKTYTFMLLAPGVEGLLQISEISWNYRERDDKFAALKAGDEIKVKIILMDEVTKKIGVSVKKLSGEGVRSAIEKLIPGNTYECETIRMTEDGIQIRFVAYPEVLGYIERSELVGRIMPGSIISAKLLPIVDRTIRLTMKASAPINTFSMSLDDFMK